LKTKLYLSNEIMQMPLQYLTDQTRPTKAEVLDLYKAYGDVQNCRKIYLDGAAATPPFFLATFVESYSASDRVWAEAVAGKLTWGKFNEARKAIAAETQSKLAEADVKIRGQLQGQHQFEMEQRQRVAEAMQQWSYQQQQLMQNQQAINALNGPRTINCNYYGSTAHCTSY